MRAGANSPHNCSIIPSLGWAGEIDYSTIKSISKFKYRGDRMRSNLGVGITLSMFGLVMVIKAIFLFHQDQNVLVSLVLDSMMYVLLALLIFIERKNLASFRVDRFSLITLMLTSFIRMRYKILGEFYVLLVIGVAGLVIGYVLISQWHNIPKTNKNSAIVGLLLGIGLGIPIAIGEVVSHSLPIYGDKALSLSLPAILLNRTVYALNYASTTEEFLFRGFLWGYFLKIGWTEQKAGFVQGLIFWLSHFEKIVFPLSFFLGLPLFIFTISKLRYHFQQVFPSLVAHTMINAITGTVTFIFIERSS